MIISSTVAILVTQIVGFLLFIAIDTLVAILAYKLGTYYKVSIDEGWYNYIVSYGSYQFQCIKKTISIDYIHFIITIKLLCYTHEQRICL
jgi:hypothetical protein